MREETQEEGSGDDRAGSRKQEAQSHDTGWKKCIRFRVTLLREMWT